MSGVTLEFGSRSGSWAAVVLFTVLFAVLRWVAMREIARRSPASGAGIARAVGLSLFVGPLALVWASSLGGFYMAEADTNVLRLHYLFPGTRTELPLTEIAAVEARPWYRGRWRLHVVSTGGDRYVSATWHRDSIEQSTERLKELFSVQRGTRPKGRTKDQERRTKDPATSQQQPAAPRTSS